MGLWLGLACMAIPPGTEARISKGIFPVVKFRALTMAVLAGGSA